MKLYLESIALDQKGKRIFAFDSENGQIHLSEEEIPSTYVDKLKVNDILKAHLNNGKIVEFEMLSEETEKKMQKMQTRVNNLFGKGKN